MSKNKIKLLTVGDDVRIPTGVGRQSRYLFEGLSTKYDFDINSLGGSYVNEPHMDLKRTTIINDNFRVLTAIKGYGNQVMYRALLDTHKPDIFMFITDPRFWFGLWDIENEIHKRNVALAYWHVWDNDPVPLFNLPFYASTDVIGCCSKITEKCTKGVLKHYNKTDKLNDRIKYIPIVIDDKDYYVLEEKKINELKKEFLEMVEAKNTDPEKNFIFFWNNRNFRRKQVGTLILTFKKLLDENPKFKDSVYLVMHTNPADQFGQNIYKIVDRFKLNNNIILSREKIDNNRMNEYYNISDCTLNVASYEGFGMSSLESLFCGTWVLNNKTGGLQDQVFEDDENYAGTLIQPKTRMLEGGQEVPYIYEDPVDEDLLLEKMKMLVEMDRTEKRKKELYTVEEAKKIFNYEKILEDWANLLYFANDNKKQFYDKIRVKTYHFEW